MMKHIAFLLTLTIGLALIGGTALAGRLTVAADIANIRSGPGKNYEVIASALYGVVFYPGKRDGEWVQVSHNDGTKGWIHRSLVWP